MKILILGHKGMLGSELFSRFSADHEVVGKDIDEFDITSAYDCRDVIDEVAPDCVINAAAYTDVDGCETDRDLCFAVNAQGVRNVAEACGDSVGIVHFSTDYVFDGTKKEPYKENDPTNPLNVYGQSKLDGERYLREMTDNYVLVRTAWLYGKNGRNFVRTILEKAGNSDVLEVVADQVGSPTYARDLAAAVQVLVEGGHRGLYHLTNRGRCSWYEFALKIIEFADLGNRIEVRPITSDRLIRKAMRPAWSVMSTMKFSNLTGKTLRFWQVALKEFIDENRAWLTAKSTETSNGVVKQS